MNECRRTAERLTEYTDGGLSPAERSEVERHLDACPPCRATAALERGGHAVLRARAEQLRAQQPAPPGLKSRCEALANEHTRPAATAPSWWRTRFVPALVMAVLIILTTAAIAVLATQRSNTVLAAQLMADHARCFGSYVSSDAPGLDAQQVEVQLAAEHGWAVHVPPSDTTRGIRLVHARQCLYAEGRVSHMLYRVNGQDVSLFMLPGVTRKDADVTAFGHHSRIWTRGANTFVLVSSGNADDLAGATRYVMQEAH